MRKITLISLALATFFCSFILADEMAPIDQCYIVISEKIPWSNALSIDIAKAIKKADMNPKYVEVYQIWPDSDRYESLYVTVGKTYKETWGANKSIFPVETRCSSGKGYMSKKMFYVSEDYTIIESKVRTSRGFLATAEDYNNVTASYKKTLAEKEAAIKAAEARAVEKEAAIKTAEARAAKARAAEKEAAIKVEKEAAIKATEEARKIAKIEAENRTKKRRIIIGGIILGILLLYILLAPVREKEKARKLKEATEAGFNTVQEFEKHKEKERKLKEAIDAGFNTIKEFEKYKKTEEEENELERLRKEAEEPKKDKSDGDFIKGVAAGVIGSFIAKKINPANHPPRVIFNDPNTRVTGMKYNTIFQSMPGWQVSYEKFDRKGKRLKSGHIYGLHKDKTRSGSSGGGYKVYW
jgi:hypothetical protein